MRRNAVPRSAPSQSQAGRLGPLEDARLSGQHGLATTGLSLLRQLLRDGPLGIVDECHVPLRVDERPTVAGLESLRLLLQVEPRSVR